MFVFVLKITNTSQHLCWLRKAPTIVVLIGALANLTTAEPCYGIGRLMTY